MCNLIRIKHHCLLIVVTTISLLITFNVLARNYTLETIATGLDTPWAMTFLPNGDVLVTERSGKLRVVRDGKLLDQAVAGVPNVYFAGQGGLLDIMLDQNFANNHAAYLSFAHGERGANATRLIAAKLTATDSGYTLEDKQVLFTAQPDKRTAHHYGARIAQMSDGSLLMTVGDGYNYRERAQTLDNHFGKIVRINPDGSVPEDNPFVKLQGAMPEIYSLGHRNQQALLVADGVIYEHEHGPQGGDEVNIIKPGVNYGWPVATHGIDYTGARISPFTEYEGMQSPLVNWTPSIAPSGMTLHNGKLYVTSLAEQSVRELEIRDGGDKPDYLRDNGVVFKDLNQRLRDVVDGPDGHLYFLTDGGEIIRLIEK